MKNLHNLDLLRSFAVILVLIDHTTGALGRTVYGTWETAFVGVFGVYLFFVHTCLVLMWSLERQPHTLNFYIRRIFRIYPLALTAIFVALVFGIPVYAGGADWQQPLHLNASTIASNILLIQDLVRRPNIVGVMWTLTIEVQMYVMLPALFFFASRERKIWQLIVLWALAVVEIFVYQHSASNTLPTVIPDFLPGAVAYLAFSQFRPRFPGWTFLPCLILFLAIYMIRPSTIHSWPIMLVFGLTLPLFHQISHPAAIWLSQTIAKYSYGIYLWHSFGMKLSFHYLVSHSGFVKVSGELAFTAAASIASYHLIEEPLIKLGSRLARANDRREALVAA